MREPQPPSKEASKAERIGYDGVAANTPKGAVVDFEEKLKQHTVVTDTGANTKCLEAFRDKKDLSPEEIDEVYKASIRAGAIDHHSIDMFMAERGVKSEKCATQMVADYPDAVLDLIKEHKITNVETHFDSDLDAATSAYLTKALIETGKLPAITEKLAAVTNKVDYGRSNELGELYQDADGYVRTISGTFSALKSAYGKIASERIAKEGFSPAILGETEAAQNEAYFAILNLANEKGIDVSGDVTALDAELPQDLRAILENGRAAVKEEYEISKQEYEAAEKGRAKVLNPEGKEVEVNLVIAKSETPLSLTNYAYTQTSPDTIVAVYAGEDRKAGDMYDIGIQPDQAKVIDMRGLCLALNKAERQKRDAIYAKSEAERSDAENKLIEGWEGQPDREAFGGLNDMIEKGEVKEEDVLRKDPTPLVAGSSLIPASRTSLLTEDEFRKVVAEHLAFEAS